MCSIIKQTIRRNTEVVNGLELGEARCFLKGIKREHEWRVTKGMRQVCEPASSDLSLYVFEGREPVIYTIVR